MTGRNKKGYFNLPKKRSRFLSKASKYVLIKSITQVIPSYCMNYFLIPNSFLEEIKRILDSFYWGLKKNGASIG